MNNKIQGAFSSINATDEFKKAVVSNLYVNLERKQKPIKNAYLKPILAICSVAIVMLMGAYTYAFYIIPVSYISIDINPSIELSLNRMDYVVKAGGYNDDGVRVLENLSLKNKSYIDAIETLLADETFSNYINNDGLLSFTVVSKNQEKLFTGIQGCEGYSVEQSKCHSAEPDMIERAKGQGMSFGKYQAFLELSKHDESITLEHCKNLSMREIQNLIDSNTNDKNITTNKPTQGHHYGNDNRNDNANNGHKNNNGHSNRNNNDNNNASDKNSSGNANSNASDKNSSGNANSNASDNKNSNGNNPNNNASDNKNSNGNNSNNNASDNKNSNGNNPNSNSNGKPISKPNDNKNK